MLFAAEFVCASVTMPHASCVTVTDPCGIAGRFTAGISNSRESFHHQRLKNNKAEPMVHNRCGYKAGGIQMEPWRRKLLSSVWYSVCARFSVERLSPKCFLTFLFMPSGPWHVTGEMTHRNTSHIRCNRGCIAHTCNTHLNAVATTLIIITTRVGREGEHTGRLVCMPCYTVVCAIC